jgi:CDP-diacylglycerol---glycerol-3-phosphate 3-phosphatidyltransferase
MKIRDEKAAVWTLPNWLSLFRILFIPAIVYLVSTQKAGLLGWSCILFILAGITDGLDGLIARKMDMKSKLGIYLDPIADKLLVSSVLIALSYYHMLALWVTILLVCREFIINGLRSFYADEGITLLPSAAGKLKTTFQIVGISCLLFSPFSRGGADVFHTAGTLIIYIALCLSLYSAFDYIYAFFRTDDRG